jgi:hypothetical protein
LYKKAAVDDSSDVSDIGGIHFNVDGTKMFIMYTTTLVLKLNKIT